MTLNDDQQHITNPASNEGAQGNFYGPVNIIYQQARATPADPQTIAATRQLLGQMPTAALPPHKPLPPGSRMPLAHNPHFVGRAPDLLAIAQAFGRGAAVAVTGLGGLGKTSVATEFVHRYGQFFAGGVFWISFAEPANIPAEVAQCGAARHLALYTDAAGLSLSEQVAVVQAAWRQDIPRLLVFDNCDDDAIEDVVREWKPASGDCRILITGRRGRWSESLGVDTLPLQTLPREQSRALLHQHRPDLDEADADAIAVELGDLPLALYLAGSYLERYRQSVNIAAYMAELRSPELLNHPSLQGNRLRREKNPTAHDLHIGRSFAVSYTHLDSTDPIDALALKLLVRAAHFAPGEPIPRALLLATLQLDESKTEALMEAEDALYRLQEVGLLTIDKQDGSSTLHRLLARFVQGTAPDDAAQAAVEQVIADTAEELNEKGIPTLLLPLLPHLRHATDNALPRVDEQAATLANELSSCLETMFADYAAARPLSEHALAIREQVLGPEHPHTANSLNSLAGLLEAQGDYAAARPLYERALAIYENVLGLAHPHTASSLNSLAWLLHAQGDVARARSLSEYALAIREQVLGAEHTYTAKSLNDLAWLLRTQRDYAAARTLLERALAIREQMLGPAHPDTAISLSNLAGLLRDEGDYAAARPLYERALTINEAAYGSEHPEVATVLHDLAALLRDEGDYTAARPLSERALAIYEQVLGPEHPYTATSLANLAWLCHDEEKFAEAVTLMQRALVLREAVLGPQHPDTQSSQRSLAAIETRLRKQNRPWWQFW
jgi:tetratricopeptide (TPR) repeat protein